MKNPFEKDPTKNTEIEELRGLADWLQSGRLDASESGGNVATRILLEDDGGIWSIPLKGGIDVVDRFDKYYMEQPGVDAIALSPDDVDDAYLAEPVIIVRWTGADDQLRTSEVDSNNMQYAPREI